MLTNFLTSTPILILCEDLNLHFFQNDTRVFVVARWYDKIFVQLVHIVSTFMQKKTENA